MGRPQWPPTTDLNAAQVREVRTRAQAQGLPLCSDPHCPNPPASDGASTASDADLCSLHRQRARNAAGLCPNCGGTMATVPIINDLTGQPRTSGITSQRQCTGCGYVQRPRPQRRGRRA